MYQLLLNRDDGFGFDWGQLINIGVQVGGQVYQNNMSRAAAENYRGQLQTQAVQARNQIATLVEQDGCVQISPEAARNAIRQLIASFLQTCQQIPHNSVAASCINIANEQQVWIEQIGRLADEKCRQRGVTPPPSTTPGTTQPGAIIPGQTTAPGTTQPGAVAAPGQQPQSLFQQSINVFGFDIPIVGLVVAAVAIGIIWKD